MGYGSNASSVCKALAVPFGLVLHVYPVAVLGLGQQSTLLSSSQNLCYAVQDQTHACTVCEELRLHNNSAGYFSERLLHYLPDTFRFPVAPLLNPSTRELVHYLSCSATITASGPASIISPGLQQQLIPADLLTLTATVFLIHDRQCYYWIFQSIRNVS